MARARWTRTHEEEAARIIESMRREAKAFDDLNPEAVARRRSLPFAEWCHCYLPHWFQVEDAPFHGEADARRNAIGIPLCECWARGTAKTTRYSIADPLYDICNETLLWRRRGGELVYGSAVAGMEDAALERVARLDHILLGAKTFDAAAEKAHLIEIELTKNARLAADYGSGIQPRLGDAATGDYIANGVRLFCRGTGQSIRSEIYNGHRPQKAIFDDCEDKRIARSREQEKKLGEWLMGGCFPALEGVGAEGVFRYLCNMYGRHCQAVQFRVKAEQKDEQGRPLALYHVHPLLTDEGQSAWLARYSTAAVKRVMAIAGSSLARSEYLCKVADELTPFKPEWFRPFDVRRLDVEAGEQAA